MFKIILPLIIVLLAAGLFMAFNFLQKTDHPGQLLSLGYDVKVREVTLKKYASQEITAERGREKIKVQLVSNVPKEKAEEVLAELKAPLLEGQKELTLFDPYTATELTLSIPEELRPVEKETIIGGRSVTYYLLHANIILSLRVYSEIEVKYRGLFATYFCPSDNTAYKTEIYYPVEEEFDEEKALNLLSSLYCK